MIRSLTFLPARGAIFMSGAKEGGELVVEKHVGVIGDHEVVNADHAGVVEKHVGVVGDHEVVNADHASVIEKHVGVVESSRGRGRSTMKPWSPLHDSTLF